MTEVELTRDALVVHVRGMDRLWALESRLEIPLSHVMGVEVNPEVAREWHKGIRARGTHVPGVITAGTFHQEGEWVFLNEGDRRYHDDLAFTYQHASSGALLLLLPLAASSAPCWNSG